MRWMIQVMQINALFLANIICCLNRPQMHFNNQLVANDTHLLQYNKNNNNKFIITDECKMQFY